MPGTVARTLPYPRDTGIDSTTALESTTSRFVLVCTSTIGVSPVTVIVSATLPTFMSALMLRTPPPATSTSSRFTVETPVSVNVTVYLPGSRSGIRYCPVESVTAARVFSSSTALAASTVTPGNTAPDESLTTPASAVWAYAALDMSDRHAAASAALLHTFHTDICSPFVSVRKQNRQDRPCLSCLSCL